METPKPQNPAPSDSLKPTVKIVFVSNNLNIARDLLSALRREEDDEAYKERLKVIPATSTIKLLEVLSNHDIDLVIAEESLIDTAHEEWIQKVNRVSAKKENGGFVPPVMVVADQEKKPFEIRQMLNSGIKDLVVKPYDFPIVLQKIDRLVPTKKILAEPQLYRMDCAEEVNMASVQLIQSISETEVVLLSKREVRIGEVVSLYSKPFSEGSDREIVAVCGFCGPSSNQKYPYRATFQLQGITPALSTSIRKWIKLTCVKKNEVG